MSANKGKETITHKYEGFEISGKCIHGNDFELYRIPEFLDSKIITQVILDLAYDYWIDESIIIDRSGDLSDPYTAEINFRHILASTPSNHSWEDLKHHTIRLGNNNSARFVAIGNDIQRVWVNFTLFSRNQYVRIRDITCQVTSYPRPEFVPVQNLGDRISKIDKESEMISVLFLAADPTDATRLRLGEEAREIQEKLQRAKRRDRCVLHQRTSVRPEDLSQAMLDIEPHVVHFSGHGTTAGALCFEDKSGKTHPIQPDALAMLFEQFDNQVSCVVLSACYSETQALAISRHIDYVIGMNQAIGDKAAIAFAIGFYQALGAGRTIEEAYKLGCVQIRLQGIPEHLTPVLVKKGAI